MYLLSHKEDVYYFLISDKEMIVLINTSTQKTIEHYISKHELSVWELRRENPKNYADTTKQKFEQVFDEIQTYLKTHFNRWK